MTDPFTIVAGGIPLAGLAIQSVECLYKVVVKFKECPRLIEDLEKNTSSLNAILEEVQRANSSSSATLDKLLMECSETCKLLTKVILDCTKHSHSARISVIDRTTFLLKEGRIKTLKDLMNSQKSMITICLVLSIANHVKGISAEDLPRIKKFIAETAAELDNVSHNLQQSEEILEKEERNPSPQHLAQLRDMHDLMERTKRCLGILQELNVAIDHFRSMAPHLNEEATVMNSYARKECISAARTVSDTLESCSQTCNGAIPSVQQRFQNIEQDLRTSKLSQNLGKEATEEYPHRLIKDRITFYRNFCKESSDILDQMPTHTFEGVFADKGALQLIMEKANGSVSAKNVTVGENGTQVLGITNEATLQLLRGRSLNVVQPSEKMEASKSRSSSTYSLKPTEKHEPTVESSGIAKGVLGFLRRCFT